MRKRFRALLAVAAASLAVVALVPATSGAAIKPPAGYDGTAHKFNGSGSDTTYNLMVELDKLYNGSPGCRVATGTGILGPQVYNYKCLPGNDDGLQTGGPQSPIRTENYDHDVAYSNYPLGSSNGIKQVCQQGTTGTGNTAYARSSRAKSGSDCAGLKFVAYARDGISWSAYGADNTGVAGADGDWGTADDITNLSQSQVNAIFVGCTVTNWSQINGGNGTPGPNMPIIVYTAQSGSGTRSAWDSFIGGNSSNCVASSGGGVIFENDAAPIFAASEEMSAIFPYSVGRYSQNTTDQGLGWVLGAVDTIAPTTSPSGGTIGDGTFPYGRFLYNVYRASTGFRDAPARVTAYVGEKGWICRDEAALPHATNPFTGNNYADDIRSAIEDEGFVQLPVGPIGGGVSGNSHCRVTTTP